MSSDKGDSPEAGPSGPIAFFVKHPVPANLLVVIFLVGGFLNLFQVQQEVFPEATPEIITVSVPYPGASPQEVEDGVVLAIESAVRGIEGVKQVRSSATENTGTVFVEWFSGTDLQRALNDVKNEVDRITSFPEQAEEPIISLPDNTSQVLSLVLHGDLTKRQLYQLSAGLRQDLLHRTSVVRVDITGLPPPEISIEVPQENLRRYGLTIPELARRLDAASIKLPGGTVETETGELRLRVTERRDTAWLFEDTVLVALPDGSKASLADLGAAIESFRNTHEKAFFEGSPAVRLLVYRTGDQTPVGVSREVREFVEEKQKELAETVHLDVWSDRSQLFDNRVGLLVENAAYGILLVLVVIGIFLRPKVAAWVTLGIPVSFLGAFLFMPVLGSSINMLSLFAFLLVLGIVVDDAIVIGEAVHARQVAGESGVSASISGTREVAVPVLFAVTTTLIAFSPMLFVPGVTGQFFKAIPLIVFPILLISLVESILILPAHLAHADSGKEKDRRKAARGMRRWWQAISNLQKRFSDGFDAWVQASVPGFVEKALAFRYLTLAIAVLGLCLALGYLVSNKINFTFLPEIEGDQITAKVEMVYGTRAEKTEEVMRSLITAAEEVIGENGGTAISKGVFAMLGRHGLDGADPASFGSGSQGTHVATVSVFLVSADERTIGSEAFASLWRERIGVVPGLEKLDLSYSAGPPTGSPVSVQITHPDQDQLQEAASRIAEELETYEAVFDINDGYTLGKKQLDFTLRPEARKLGLSETDLALQLRGAVFGSEVERQQRGRDELRVYVRLPDTETRSEHMVERLVLRTPGGGEMLLSDAAEATRTYASTTINRRDGQRVVTITADIDEAVTSGGNVTRDIIESFFPTLQQEYPSLGYFYSGEREDQREATSALGRGMVIALLVMYALMAVAFNSYSQPVIILFVIPFGFIGALLGHILMNFNISMVSLFGLVALSGVVVNDALVLVSAVNDRRRGRSMDLREALQDAAVRRFRPVLLTSLTTFCGLAPMIFETAVQARFLIPMALSLGFGILFVTPLTILLLPAAYHILEDVRSWTRSSGRQ